MIEWMYFSSMILNHDTPDLICIPANTAGWSVPAKRPGNVTSCHAAFRIVIYKALCFDVAQGRMNGAPNETRTHSCRFASLSC